MGGGSWTSKSFSNYASVRGMSLSTDGAISGSYSNQEMFKARKLDDALNVFQKTRECCDSEEHPNTLPVILALDVTGSMGQAAVEVAKKLNVIMTKLYAEMADVEFMIMGIGDLAYDFYPIQATQFESDIRIAEQLDKVFFELGGGGNGFESYSAAWYFGSRHTKLDCWNRGKKGIIITMGDETLNPHLPLKGRYSGMIKSLGVNLEKDIDTKDIYKEASEKFDIYHIDVVHGYRYLDDDTVKLSFSIVIGDDHFYRASLDNIADKIVEIIVSANKNETAANVTSEGIKW